MEVDESKQRLAWVDQVLDSRPVIHPEAPNGAAWSTESTCYRLMASNVKRGSRTLETGAGISTVLFAAWGCDHLAVVPFQNEADAIIRYCEEHQIDSGSLHFDIRPSEVALPEITRANDEFDLVFIDGCHGFPMPIIDWFYGAGALRIGGVVVFDDIQLPQVRILIDTFIDRDERWERLAATGKWMAFKRMSTGPLAEGELDQEFFPAAKQTPWRRMKDLVPLGLKRALRKVLSLDAI